MPDLKCPRGEESWVGYYDTEGRRVFLLTSKQNNRDWYYLYECQPDGTLKKLGKAKTPPELEHRYKVVEKMFA